IARLLIARGANVSTASKNGYNTLLFAAQQGDINSVKLLLAAKVDPRFKAPDGNTAFLIALGRGHEAVARLMLEHGAEVNSRDRSEEHTSELQSRVDLVCRLLLEKKNIYDTQKGTLPPRMLADLVVVERNLTKFRHA